MSNRLLPAVLLPVLTGVSVQAIGAAGATTESFDVVWDSPSEDSSGSMPIGNGDIGLNVWVEQGGDLLFYIGKTDAWDENARLVKLGRIRIAISPNPFAKGAPFRQQLDLQRGAVEVVAGKPNSQVAVRVWVDANQPVIRVEVSAQQDVAVRASLEIWRTAERRLTGKELFSAYGMDGSPNPVVVHADTVLPIGQDRIVWHHRNPASVWPATMKLQGLESWMAGTTDPLLHRTFGGVVKGEGLMAEGPMSLASKTQKRNHVVSIYVLTAQTSTPQEWVERINKTMAEIDAVGLDKARASHQAWWQAFWDRSYVRLSGHAERQRIAQAYALQRFISACAGRGAYPIKFNGSIFTVDSREAGERFDADYRRWGGPYWFQNTRLPYWPMLGSGDYEMMRPLFKMFLDILPMATARTRIYFGHEGAFFPETQYFWGAYANDNYGWDRKGKPVSHVDNTYIRWYWSGGLELTAMMVDYHAHTQDREFVKSTLLPLAEAILTFYDKHYARDDNGKVLFKPAQALETWQNVVNPLPEIVGLRFVIDGLTALPEGLVSEQQRTTWVRLRGELPPIPTTQISGKTTLAPAEKILGPIANSENPELYAIFPYRLFGVTKPDLELARLTFAHRRHKGNNGWQQDDTQAAFLGLAAEASQRVGRRLASKNPGSRFPAFWGPNFDWIPDQDHGCNGLMALQTMLLQAEGRKILLFPAWPKDWDVEFKLHAPLQTTVECAYRGGRIDRLTVTPESRAQDVITIDPQ